MNYGLLVGVVVLAWAAGIILVLAGLRNISRHNAEQHDDDDVPSR